MITVTDNASGSPHTINLFGSGQAAFLNLDTTSLAFGNQALNTASTPKTIGLQVTGSLNVTVSSIAISGTATADFQQTNNCGTLLVATLQKCTITVIFTPSVAASRTATLTITDNTNDLMSPHMVTLTGTGVTSGVSFSQSSLTFGSQTTGTSSAPQSITLSNTGSAALAINNISASGDFSQANNCGSSVAASSTCAISVTFTPGATGTRVGTLTVNDSAPGSPHTVSLTGIGAAAVPLPVITAVQNAASPVSGITVGSWVSIFGVNLAPTGDARLWNSATEIVNGKFPLSLDGVSVTINGKPAVVEYIQPTQINIQPPDDTAVGPVRVIVTTSAGMSNSFTVSYVQFDPALFPFTGTYVVAQHADGSYVTSASPAQPSEVITLWGTGFGPGNPGVPSGQVFNGASRLANQPTMTIGGQNALIDFAGIVGAGLVQINVHVPANAANGDLPVTATVGGAISQTTNNLISVHN